MEKYFYAKYTSFCKSLDSLSLAKARSLEDPFVLSGTIAKFSITFDIAWKIMKEIAEQYYGVSDFAKGSPRDVLRVAYSVNLITGDIWSQMLKSRNNAAHKYDDKEAYICATLIVNKYIDKLFEFKDTVNRLDLEKPIEETTSFFKE